MNVMAMDVYPKSRWFGRKFEVSSDSFCGLMVDSQKGSASNVDLIDSGGVNKIHGEKMMNGGGNVRGCYS